MPPMSCSAALRCASFFRRAFFARFGTEPISAYLIGVRILAFSFVPGLGFAHDPLTSVVEIRPVKDNLGAIMGMLVGDDSGVTRVD